MASTKQELIDEVRSFGDYTVEELSDSDIEVSISRAQKTLKKEAQLDSPNWYSDARQEDALFWATMLFTKLQTSALDAKAITVGAITENELLAAADGDVTLWYQNYRKSKQALVSEKQGTRVSTAERTTVDGNRYYEKETL